MKVFSLLLIGFFLFFPSGGWGKTESDPPSTQPSQRKAAPLEEAGTLAGEVVDLNRSKGIIAVRGANGKINRIRLDEAAQGDLRDVRPGDRVLMTLTIEAKSIRPNGKKERAPSADRPRQLTGEVVSFDRETQELKIRTEEGGMTILYFDEEATPRLKEIGPGDRVAVTLTLEAASVKPDPAG